MKMLRFLALMVVAVTFAQGMLIKWPFFAEETIHRYNIGKCHKKILEKSSSYRKMRKICMPWAARAAGIENFLDDNIVPEEIGDFHQYLIKFATCKVEYSGAIQGDYVDFDAYIRFLDFPDPATLDPKRQRELEHLKDAIEKCREESCGDTVVDVMLNFDRCIEIKYRDWCEERDKQIGVKNDMKLSFLSFNTISRCPNVRIPENDFQKWLDCADTVSADFGTPAGYDIRNILPDTDDCFYEAVGFPDDVAGYMNSLDGWEEIPQKREEINKVITLCEKAYDPNTEVEFESFDDGYDDGREANARLAMYTDCLSPRINRICGMNSDVALILEPPLNWRVRAKIFSIIEEKTGNLPLKIIGLVKVALFEP